MSRLLILYTNWRVNKLFTGRVKYGPNDACVALSLSGANPWDSA